MVLAGGSSREREVSFESGKAVTKALIEAGFEVETSDITSDNLSALDSSVDLFFPVLHGTFGEDGQLQEIMEKRNLRFCGSPSSACKIAMNKYECKLKVLDLGIPTPRFDIARTKDEIQTAKACWSLPVVVKPVTEGSSIGITIVKEAEELEAVIEKTLADYGPIIVEQYISGKEITVGILKDTPLPIIEIKTQREFYDYEAKYIDESTEYIFTEDLPKDVYEYLQRASLEIYHHIGMRDFARIDWRVDEENRPFFLEVNPIPGFTSHSLLPKAANKAGFPMPTMCKIIVESAMERYYSENKTCVN